MIRMIIATSFWGLAVSLAASKYAIDLAIPLGILLAAIGLKFLIHGMPIGIYLAIVTVFWFVAVLQIGFQGMRAMRRGEPEEASRRWTTCISMIGLALTFVVAVQSSPASLDSIQGDSNAGRAKWFAKTAS